MLTPNELEAIPEPLVKLFRQLELDVMRDIIGRLSVNRDISRTADWEISRLYELGVSKRVIKKRIKDALKLSTREINLIYKNVIWQDYARYEPIYRTKGKPWIPYEKNRQLQQLVSGIKEQTLGEFKNITQSLGFAVKRPDGTRVFQPIAEYYQKTLDNAAMGMLSGVYDYNTMIKKAVRELTDSGLRSVDYYTEQDDGSMKLHTNRVEVAARRALMTGFNQVVAKITEENAEQLGTDKFEVTYHRGARPTHQPWQGRVYTREQLVTVCGYGDVTGLKGANCYHDFHPFFEGLSKRLYTDEELDRMNAEENTPKQYGDKEYTAYEALQRQRRMEASLRRKRGEIELLEKGEANEDDINAVKAKYHALSSEYAEFSKAMDLPQQRERIRVDGRKGVDVSFGKQAANDEKPVAKSGESGIIKTGGKITADNYLKAEHYENQAKQFYLARVKNNDDVQLISFNSGFSANEISAIKEHIMVSEHLFKDGSVRRFDPDIDQALAWQRLMEGNATETDVLLLRHELEELRYLQKHKCDYETAHAYANRRYNWEDVIDDVLETDEIKSKYLD